MTSKQKNLLLKVEHVGYTIEYMPSKNDINPATGKPYAVNPNTGVWDDNYFATVVEPQLRSQYGGDSGGSGNKVLTAEDIIGAQQDKLKEQITFLKDFLEKNPLGFDEVLARQMADEKYKPYYQEVLADFVEPLQTRITRSTADEQRLVGELVRRRGVGSREIQDTTRAAIDRSREGFAGAGLLGSGIESGVTARQNIAGTNKLDDFIAGNEYQQAGVTTEATRTREDAQKAIDQKQRDIFGRGREFETNVAKDVENQRGTSLKQRGLSTLEAISSRFGSPLPDIPNYLSLYNV